MAVDRTVSLVLSSRRMAEGPTNVWIWCAWKRTRVSWSQGERDCVGVQDARLKSDLHENLLWKPEANFRALDLLSEDSNAAALSLQATRDASSKIHDRAWVDRSKSMILLSLSWQLAALERSENWTRDLDRERCACGFGREFCLALKISLGKTGFEKFKTEENLCSFVVCDCRRFWVTEWQDWLLDSLKIDHDGNPPCLRRHSWASQSSQEWFKHPRDINMRECNLSKIVSLLERS